MYSFYDVLYCDTDFGFDLKQLHRRHKPNVLGDAIRIKKQCPAFEIN